MKLSKIMQSYDGIFIMLDGIAGSGKSTLLQALKISIEKAGKTIFDIKTWNETNHKPPTFEEISGYDVYFTIEPSKTWLGSAIRNEISFHPEYYSARTQAEAFALDRLIQYRRLIIPALQSGKIVIQDRGITTSLVYQSTLDPMLTMHDIAMLTGNALALEYAPQHLILTSIDPSLALARRAIRDDQSKGIYEDAELLRRAQDAFHGSDFCDVMKAHGTTIHTLDTSGTIAESTHAIQSLIHSIIQL